jgi:hypothetical protein
VEKNDAVDFDNSRLFEKPLPVVALPSEGSYAGKIARGVALIESRKELVRAGLRRRKGFFVFRPSSVSVLFSFVTDEL